MNFEIENGILKKYKGSTPDIIIPSCVTEIADKAFKGNYYLKSVIITENVKKIGIDAFKNCTYLEEVILPVNLIKIRGNAFSNTKWLRNKQATEKDVVIINGIVIARADNIGESINLEGVKYICDIFKDCNQIKEFIISDGLKIGSNAFFTTNDFNICLKSNIMYVNIPIRTSELEKYRAYSNNDKYKYEKRFNYRTQSLFDFIGADMEQREILFNDLEIPEYRYPVAVFMANTYQSKFFKTFIDVHIDKILEYAENNDPDLLKFINKQEVESNNNTGTSYPLSQNDENAIESGEIRPPRSIWTYYDLTSEEKQILK